MTTPRDTADALVEPPPTGRELDLLAAIESVNNAVRGIIALEFEAHDGELAVVVDELRNAELRIANFKRRDHRMSGADLDLCAYCVSLVCQVQNVITVRGTPGEEPKQIPAGTSGTIQQIADMGVRAQVRINVSLVGFYAVTSVVGTRCCAWHAAFAIETIGRAPR